MTRLAVSCYVLAVLGLALSAQVGWAAALVACVALAAAVAFQALERRVIEDTSAARAMLAKAATDAESAREDVKRLRTELHATLEQLRTRAGVPRPGGL